MALRVALLACLLDSSFAWTAFADEFALPTLEGTSLRHVTTTDHVLVCTIARTHVRARANTHAHTRANTHTNIRAHTQKHV